MNSTFLVTTLFTVAVVIVPQLIAAYVNAPRVSPGAKKDKSRPVTVSFALERKEVR